MAGAVGKWRVLFDHTSQSVIILLEFGIWSFLHFLLVLPETVLPCRTMNIIIEDAVTLEFFSGDSRWTKNIAEGKRYARTVLAVKAAKQELIGKFNIVGYIGDTGQFINLDHGHGKGAVEKPA